MKDFHTNIFYSEEDEGYIADIPDLEFCSAVGDTPEDALRELGVAKKPCFEAAAANEKTILKPKYRPAIYQVAA